MTVGCRGGNRGKSVNDAVRVPAKVLVITLLICAQPSFTDRLEVVALIAGARRFLLDVGHELPLEKRGETAAPSRVFLAGLNE